MENGEEFFFPPNRILSAKKLPKQRLNMKIIGTRKLRDNLLEGWTEVGRILVSGKDERGGLFCVQYFYGRGVDHLVIYECKNEDARVPSRVPGPCALSISPCHTGRATI